MLYFIRPCDSLSSIAGSFGTTVEAIIKANIICNPEIICAGLPIIIPEPGMDLPVAGGGPYYIVQPGDTLSFISSRFDTTNYLLARINSVAETEQLVPGYELLILDCLSDAKKLSSLWTDSCRDHEKSISERIYEIYYKGAFQWAALGRESVNFLVDLLYNPCEIVQLYAAYSLGLIGGDDEAADILLQPGNNARVDEMRKMAAMRIKLVNSGKKRVHLITSDTRLFSMADLGSAAITMPKGTPIRVLKWFIPSPSGEQGMRGGIQIYDYVEVASTGQKGFLPRVGFNEIQFI